MSIYTSACMHIVVHGLPKLALKSWHSIFEDKPNGHALFDFVYIFYSLHSQTITKKKPVFRIVKSLDVTITFQLCARHLDCVTVLCNKVCSIYFIAGALKVHKNFYARFEFHRRSDKNPQVFSNSGRPSVVNEKPCSVFVLGSCKSTRTSRWKPGEEVPSNLQQKCSQF